MPAGDEARSLPLVSIVTPSLNQGRFIDATIRSVRAQDYPRIEHLVVDGGSRDETLAVLAAHSPSPRWVSSRMTARARPSTAASRMASGDILSWLNADDLLLPGAVSAVVEAFRSDPRAMMVYGDGQLIDAAGKELQPFRFTEAFNLRRLIEVHDYISSRRRSSGGRRCRRSATWTRASSGRWTGTCGLRTGRRFPVRYLPVPLAQVRIHPDAKTSRAGFAKLAEMRRIVRRHSQRRLPPVLLIHGGGTVSACCAGCSVGPPARPRAVPGCSAGAPASSTGSSRPAGFPGSGGPTRLAARRVDPRARERADRAADVPMTRAGGTRR